MRMLVPLNKEQSDPPMVGQLFFLVDLFYKTIHIFICVILELIQPMIAEGSHSMHTNSSYSIHSSTASQFSLMPPR